MLTSIAPRSSFLSLTVPAQLSAGDQAIQRLLDAVRSPHSSSSAISHAHSHSLGAPSFFSAGMPRDRRGRIGGKETDWQMRWKNAKEDDDDDDDWGGETPRIGGTGGAAERERQKEFLDSLRLVLFYDFFVLINSRLFLRKTASILVFFLYLNVHASHTFLFTIQEP